MRRGILIIDRGSREREAAEELEIISEAVKTRGKYDFADYCFLEVVPPFIEDGMKRALSKKLDRLVLVPYFLYPGKKVKQAVTTAMQYQKNTGTKLLVTKAMSMHPTLVELVHNRITTALRDANNTTPQNEVDVLIIGHGSKDTNAKMSIQYIVDSLRPRYRSVDHCFLEIEQPDIATGIQRAKQNSPKTLVAVFYFLHEGAHVKTDINADLGPALEEAGLADRCVVTRHLGADQTMIELILERAAEIEG